MRFAGYRIGFAVLLSLMCLKSVDAQIDRWGYWENGVSESWWFSPDEFTTQQAESAIAKWKQLGDELKVKSANDWVGDYFRGGETHGTYLRWSTTGFVIVHVDKCQAKVMGLSYGEVDSSRALLAFNEQFKNQPKEATHVHNTGGPTKIFVPVKWRGALLLIDESEMPDFGEYVAGLGRFNGSGLIDLISDQFFRKLDRTAGDSAVQGEGEPQLPPGFEQYLRKPITASIIAVNSRQIRKSHSYESPDGTGTSYYEPVSLNMVTINAGSEQGLKRGMFLHVSYPRETEAVRILRVNRSTAIGVIIRSLVDGKEIFFDKDSNKLEHSRIVRGWRLTTSVFD